MLRSAPRDEAFGVKYKNKKAGLSPLDFILPFRAPLRPHLAPAFSGVVSPSAA